MSAQALTFDIDARDGAARTGVLTTGRGEIHTPAFMPVGTAGTVKAMRPESVKATGAEIILGNTCGGRGGQGAGGGGAWEGCVRCRNWPGPFRTDSGG